MQVILQKKVKFGPHQVTLLNLIEDWAVRVLKVEQDSAVDVPGASTWTAHDLVGAYYLRDSIGRGLGADIDETSSELAYPPLAAIDELLMKITTETTADYLRMIDPAAPVGHWWWRQVPIRGPIAEEIRVLETTGRN